MVVRQELGAQSSRYLERVPHALPADVQLWRVDLDAYAAAVALDALAADEHARAARMPLGPDARRYLAGRHALRQVLAEALDRSPQDLVIEPDELGKPHLLPRGDLHFNLSHSAHESLIGLSRDQPIGVDIEVVHEVVDADALAGAHFTDGERAAWSRAAQALRDRTFLACWTRKEACLKALGVGLSAQPASIDVGCTPDLRVVTIPLGVRRCEVTLQSLALPSESVAAVALATPEAVRMARELFRCP
jgi:4'-phosphopantetheinyl transferase